MAESCNGCGAPLLTGEEVGRGMHIPSCAGGEGSAAPAMVAAINSSAKVNVLPFRRGIHPLRGRMLPHVTATPPGDAPLIQAA